MKERSFKLSSVVCGYSLWTSKARDPSGNKSFRNSFSSDVVMGVASGQCEKRSIQVKTYEQPKLTGHGPTISMWTCQNCFSGRVKTPRRARMWSWTLARWHSRQAWAKLVITRCILGKRNGLPQDVTVNARYRTLNVDVAQVLEA